MSCGQLGCGSEGSTIIEEIAEGVSRDGVLGAGGVEECHDGARGSYFVGDLELITICYP